MRKTLNLIITPLLFVALAFGLSACETARNFTFGTAEAQELRAFRVVSIYTGLAVLAEDDGLINLDKNAYDSIVSTVAAMDNGPAVFEKT